MLDRSIGKEIRKKGGEILKIQICFRFEKSDLKDLFS